MEGCDQEDMQQQKKPLLTYGTGSELLLRHIQQHVRHLLRCTHDSVWKIIFCLVLTPICIYASYLFLNTGGQPFPFEMTTFLELTLTEREELFSKWTESFGKTYESVEIEAAKMAVFFENCEKIAKHNLAGKHTYTLGMNNFGDLTREEFQRIYASGHLEEPGDLLGWSEHVHRRQLDAFDEDEEDDDDEEIGGDLPDELDWEKKGLTTSVKTQGHCGACYIFSTLAAVETRCAIRNWPLRSLSVQAELDCLDDQSCVKGFQSHVYKFGIRKKGFEPENKYDRYSGEINSCQDDKAEHVDALKDWGKISSHSEEDTKRELQNGPVSTAICTTSIEWQFLKDGVVKGGSCEGLTHGVTLVGYGVHGESKEKYWKIKNSWGPHWGMGGYALLCRGDDCGENTQLGFAAILKQLYFPICTDRTTFDASEETSNSKTFLDALLDEFSNIFG